MEAGSLPGFKDLSKEDPGPSVGEKIESDPYAELILTNLVRHLAGSLKKLRVQDHESHSFFTFILYQSSLFQRERVFLYREMPIGILSSDQHRVPVTFLGIQFGLAHFRFHEPDGQSASSTL